MPAMLHPSYLRILFVAALLLATSFTTPPVAPQSPPLVAPRTQRARVVENYGKLPLSFEANTGQTNSAVKFLSRGRGYTLFLTSDEAVLAFRRQKEGNRQLPVVSRQFQRTTDHGPRTRDVLRLRLVGANPAAKVMGLRELPGKTNYFLGNDPKKWRAGVPTYAEVRYAGLYPGIDLVYHGIPSADGPNGPSADGQLEFDFVVAPGADPKAIALEVGASLAAARPAACLRECFGREAQSLRAAAHGRPRGSPLQIAANGDLVISTKDGELRFHKPVVYQMVGGHRQPVAGEFALLGKHRVGFRLGSYDSAKALVIDPALAFSTFLGGSGGETGNAIAVDAAGNVYVAGRTASIDFPVTPGAYQTTNHVGNGSTAFVTKLNPTGTALVYSTYLGGSGGETASAIAVDTAGNAYVAGSTASTDFAVTQGAFQTTNNAAANDTTNAFVTKLNPSGTALVYSTYLGGSGVQGNYFSDKGSAIAVDAAGNAYVTGQTISTDFPVTQGAFQTTNHAAANGVANGFVAKLNPTATELVYSTYLGGSGGNHLGFPGDLGSAIATDVAGDAYVTGQAGSSDFPVTPGAYQLTNRAAANEGTNAFVTKLNPTGTALVYSNYLGGSGSDTGNAMAVDSAGNLYVAGQTASTDFPVTAGAFQTTNHATNNGPNVFVTKLNPAGAALVYSTYLGGSGGAINLMATLAMWGGDVATGLAIDSSGNAYVTGSTASTDFPVTEGAFQTSNNDQPPCGGSCIGGYNAFITELSSTGSALVYSTYLGGNGINPGDFVGVAEFGNGDQATALALDNSGNVYVTGSAVSYDFPVTGGAFQSTLNSQYGNAFVAKLNTGVANMGPGFTITATPVTTQAGATTGNTSTITVTPSGGFTGSVALTAAVTSSPSPAMDPPTLSFGSTSPVSITGTAAGTATLTIATTAPNNCVNAAYQTPRGFFWYTGGGGALALMLLFGITARRRRRRLALAMLALLVTLMWGWLACGGGGSGGTRNCGPIIPGTTAGTYTITVTGTSGSATGTGAVTLTVQ